MYLLLLSRQNNEIEIKIEFDNGKQVKLIKIINILNIIIIMVRLFCQSG